MAASHAADRMNAPPPDAGIPPPRADLLRPRSVVRLLDDGYASLRAAPALTLGTGALFLVPLVLVVALLGDGEPTPGLVTSGSWAAGAVSVLGFSLAPALMGVPLARAVAIRAAGEEPRWRRCYRGPRRTWWTVTACWAALLPARLVAFALLGLPGVALTVLVVPLTPVITLERLSARAALRRTLRVGGRGFGRGLSLVLAQWFIGAFVSSALLLLPVALITELSEYWQRAAGNLLQLAIGLVLGPAAAWTAAAFYLDERIRRDGLDLQRAVQDWAHPTVGMLPGMAAAAGPGR